MYSLQVWHCCFKLRLVLLRGKIGTIYLHQVKHKEVIKPLWAIFNVLTVLTLMPCARVRGLFCRKVIKSQIKTKQTDVMEWILWVGAVWATAPALWQSQPCTPYSTWLILSRSQKKPPARCTVSLQIPNLRTNGLQNYLFRPAKVKCRLIDSFSIYYLQRKTPVGTKNWKRAN